MTTKQKVFRTNHIPVEHTEQFIKGYDQSLPNQAPKITEIIYRFQGGIIPNVNNIQFDPVEAPDDFIHIKNQSGFDITDAFHALQQGRKEYREYMNDKNAKARAAVEAKKVEFERLQNFEKQTLDKKELKDNINEHTK